jgi:hypothetical protein
MFSTFPSKFKLASIICKHSNDGLAAVFSTDYGFNTGAGGLAYLGLGVGFLIAALFGAKFGSETYRRVSVERLSTPTLFFSLYFSAFRKEWRSWKTRDAHSGSMCWVPIYSCWSTVRSRHITYIIWTAINSKCRWYGWSAEAKLHFMMPIVGTGIYGFGEFYANSTRGCWLNILGY